MNLGKKTTAEQARTGIATMGQSVQVAGAGASNLKSLVRATRPRRHLPRSSSPSRTASPSCAGGPKRSTHSATEAWPVQGCAHLPPFCQASSGKKPKSCCPQCVSSAVLPHAVAALGRWTVLHLSFCRASLLKGLVLNSMCGSFAGWLEDPQKEMSKKPQSPPTSLRTAWSLSPKRNLNSSHAKQAQQEAAHCSRSAVPFFVIGSTMSCPVVSRMPRPGEATAVKLKVKPRRLPERGVAACSAGTCELQDALPSSSLASIPPELSLDRGSLARSRAKSGTGGPRSWELLRCTQSQLCKWCWLAWLNVFAAQGIAMWPKVPCHLLLLLLRQTAIFQASVVTPSWSGS